MVSNSLSVWGKALHDGALAMVLLNNNRGDKSVECDAACWGRTHFKPGTTLLVRNLTVQGVPHAPVSITVPATFAVVLPGKGASAVYKFSPVSQFLNQKAADGRRKIGSKEKY